MSNKIEYDFNTPKEVFEYLSNHDKGKYLLNTMEYICSALNFLHLSKSIDINVYVETCNVLSLNIPKENCSKFKKYTEHKYWNKPNHHSLSWWNIPLAIKNCDIEEVMDQKVSYLKELVLTL